MTARGAIPVGVEPRFMASVVDIACPFCEHVEGVQKRDLDRYYCPDCEREFSLSDLV